MMFEKRLGDNYPVDSLSTPSPMGDSFYQNAEFATYSDLAVKTGLESVWTVDRSCAAALNRVASASSYTI